MSPSLFDKLEAMRRQQFVGRTTEQEVIREALTAAELPFVLLYLFGPGGVGKTSLLRETLHLARQLQIQTCLLDGRDLDPSPASFLSALQQWLKTPDSDAVFTALAQQNGRFLLLLDTAELLKPLDGWLRDTFLPQLPGNVLVIIAGRNPPSLRWRTDPGWQQLMRVLSLKNLNQEESRAFLMRRQVPAREHVAVMQFTHGHPLALSLVADVFAQQPDTRFAPEEAPDIIKTLLDQFMQEAPSTHHRAALEASSQVRLLNEPLLGAMLQVDDPHPIFTWLRDLSFIDAERRGLFPHDLAREAMAVDLHWRNPTWQAELHNRARKYYIDRFSEGGAREQRQVLSDYIFLHRDNPMIRPYFEWQSSGTVFTDLYKPEDKFHILQMIGTHEGETAVRIAEHWLERQQSNVFVFRQADGSLQGVLLLVSLEKTTAADHKLDPGAAVIWDYLTRHAPLRPGETATLFRFWMARDEYQAVSPVQSRIFLNMVQHYLTTPGLALTFIPCAEPEFWTAVFGFADLHRITQADFTVGERTFGLYGHDWRVTPPLNWLALMAERELGGAISIPDHSQQPSLVLDEAAFTEAVHDALRDMTNELALQDNLLLQTRLITEAAGPTAGRAERINTLKKVLYEGAEAMQAHPRQTKWYRALYHTYLQPAATQEQAAELLDIPFSTYRRHLRSAVQYVKDRLWHQEIQ